MYFSQLLCVSELWLSWLQDEISLAASDVERSAVVELFERAVQDYLCKQFFYYYVVFFCQMSIIIQFM
jgi:hypothetical protein